MTLSADSSMDVVGYNDIVLIAQDIWASFLDLPLDAVPADTVDISAMPMVSGVVQVSDAWTGAVQLECSGDFGRLAAGRMFSTDPTLVSDVDLRDAMGELTNMIGGNIKSLLPAPSHLSLPEVTYGHGLQPLDGLTPVGRIAFLAAAEPVFITIWRR